ncbi:hypothetical protein HYU14_07040 [Candidatus Woesearchaeota archaeon]|nr:hypothetical protein [Candidatus Woesearchaeota archaeon]
MLPKRESLKTCFGFFSIILKGIFFDMTTTQLIRNINSIPLWGRLQSEIVSEFSDKAGSSLEEMDWDSYRALGRKIQRVLDREFPNLQTCDPSVVIPLLLHLRFNRMGEEGSFINQRVIGKYLTHSRPQQDLAVLTRYPFQKIRESTDYSWRLTQYFPLCFIKVQIQSLQGRELMLFIHILEEASY